MRWIYCLIGTGFTAYVGVIFLDGESADSLLVTRVQEQSFPVSAGQL